jgi:hydrogenase expression/formation protein HypE
MTNDLAFSALTAVDRDARITLKHGAGGRAMRGLIQEAFLDAFVTDPPQLAGVIGLAAMDDGGAVRIGDRWLVLTTDSHVIQPAFFPGGDIGRLAIAGTVNDLAMMGATDVLGLTCSVIIEDGFLRHDLDRILGSMRQACHEAGASVLAGDTKVMGKGEIDGIVINTAGVAMTTHLITDRGLRPGDRIIVTGTIGDHGMAVMATRHGLALDTPLASDVAPINGLIRAALSVDPTAITAMKDPTRGGVAGVLHEMASKGRVGVIVDERALPIGSAVRGISELVGIDPLLVANEGKAVMAVRADAADAVLSRLRAHPLGRSAAIIGICTDERPGMVVLDTGFGRRIVAEPEGELLPRIC